MRKEGRERRAVASAGGARLTTRGGRGWQASEQAITRREGERHVTREERMMEHISRARTREEEDGRRGGGGRQQRRQQRSRKEQRETRGVGTDGRTNRIEVSWIGNSLSFRIMYVCLSVSPSVSLSACEALTQSVYVSVCLRLSVSKTNISCVIVPAFAA